MTPNTQLSTLLASYRNGERLFPTYAELAAIAGGDHDGHAQINQAPTARESHDDLEIACSSCGLTMGESRALARPAPATQVSAPIERYPDLTEEHVSMVAAIPGCSAGTAATVILAARVVVGVAEISTPAPPSANHADAKREASHGDH